VSFEASAASSLSETGLGTGGPASPPSLVLNDGGRVSNEHLAIFDNLFDGMDQLLRRRQKPAMALINLLKCTRNVTASRHVLQPTHGTISRSF
jgi:hypothetical protein